MTRSSVKVGEAHVSYMELADAREEANTAWMGEAEQVFQDARMEFEKVKKEVEDKESSDWEKSSRKALEMDIWWEAAKHEQVRNI